MFLTNQIAQLLVVQSLIEIFAEPKNLRELAKRIIIVVSL